MPSSTELMGVFGADEASTATLLLGGAERPDGGAAARLESSPMLGQHTEDVVAEWLGLNDAAVAELKAEGVFGEPPAAAAE